MAATPDVLDLSGSMGEIISPAHKILYMAEPHPYSICRRREPQNYTLPGVRQSQKETAPQLLVANQEHLTLPWPMKEGRCVQPVGAQRGFHDGWHRTQQVLPCVQEVGIAHTLPLCSKLLGQRNTVILTFAATKYRCNLSSA